MSQAKRMRESLKDVLASLANRAVPHEGPASLGDAVSRGRLQELEYASALVQAVLGHSGDE